MRSVKLFKIGTTFYDTKEFDRCRGVVCVDAVKFYFPEVTDHEEIELELTEAVYSDLDGEVLVRLAEPENPMYSGVWVVDRHAVTREEDSYSAFRELILAENPRCGWCVVRIT